MENAEIRKLEMHTKFSSENLKGKECWGHFTKFKCEDNIKMELRGVVGEVVDWIQLAHVGYNGRL
jgi:hypothetical protein